MFEERSVAYTDSRLKYAVSKIAKFEADFGGTKIFEPLQIIF